MGVALAFGVAAAARANHNETSQAGRALAAPEKIDGAPAAAAIGPYIGHPSPFPVNQPLKKIPRHARIAFVDCGTPICGLFWQLLQPAAKTMGVKLTRYQAGTAANTVAAALDTVVAAKPSAVIVAAVDIELWKNQLKQLQAAHIPVVTTGIIHTKRYGIKAAQIGDAWSAFTGKLLADYAAAKDGVGSKVAFYEVPELTFTRLMAAAFKAELPKVCPSCSVRVVDIPVATTGNTAPNLIVSDLQAHPDTTVIAFASDETETGLPSALQTAGIHVKTLGSGPNPTNLEYLKEGKENAVLAADLPVLSWTLLDQAARQLVGQPLTGLEAKGITDIQFLTPGEVTFDPSHGWTGYPNFVQRFKKLWGIGR